MTNEHFLRDVENEILRRIEMRELKVEVLADMAGVAVMSVRNLYNGKNCNMKTLIKVCDALDIKLKFE